jgi:hypothetical protein
MTSTNICVTEKLFAISENKLYMDRYIKFINHYESMQYTISGYFEYHHILPKSLFPEFKISNFNLIKLPHRAHFIAHYLLAKATNNYKMISAFNGMCNQNKQKHQRSLSVLYAAAKKMFSESQRGSSNIGYGMVSAWDKQLNTRVRVTKEQFYSNKEIYGGVTCKEALQWKTIHENYIQKPQSEYQRMRASETSLNTASAKLVSTGESLGRISKNDIRWSTGEIVSANKKC